MTYREKIAELRPDCISEHCIGGVQACPGDYFDGARMHSINGCFICERNCVACWNQEMPVTEEEPTSFQEDMMEVLGDMTKAQAKFAIEWLWNKYFKEED